MSFEAETSADRSPGAQSVVVCEVLLDDGEPPVPLAPEDGFLLPPEHDTAMMMIRMSGTPSTTNRRIQYTRGGCDPTGDSTLLIRMIVGRNHPRVFRRNTSCVRTPRLGWETPARP